VKHGYLFEEVTDQKIMGDVTIDYRNRNSETPMHCETKCYNIGLTM